MKIKPNKTIPHKNQTKDYFEDKKKKFNYPKLNSNFFWLNNFKAGGPSSSERTDNQPLTHKYGTFFLKLDNATSLLPKKTLVHCFLTQNNSLPWTLQATMANNLHHPRTGIHTICRAKKFSTLWPPNQSEHLDRLGYI